MILIAHYGLVILLSLFLVFHLCILLKVIPYSIVWGGRLKTDTEMYRFETVSILINLVFLLIALAQSPFLIIDLPNTVLTILLWVLAALFLFNTFGNALSKNKLEQIIFTPITVLLTIFSVISAVSN